MGFRINCLPGACFDGMLICGLRFAYLAGSLGAGECRPIRWQVQAV